MADRLVRRSHPAIALLPLLLASCAPTYREAQLVETIQQLCEELGVAYTGSDPQASRLGLDKVASRKRFVEVGLSVPKWQVVDRSAIRRLDEILKDASGPFVVKPTNQGSSIGVSIVTHREAVAAAMEEAANFDTRILIEEFVKGREVTVGILADEALPVVEIKPSERFFDYTAKYTPGHTTYVVPAVLDPGLTSGIQAAALKAHRALGCRDFSRIDCILNEANEPIILEVNTIPGLTATSLLPKAAGCVGISYDDLCERLAIAACRRQVVPWERLHHPVAPALEHGVAAKPQLSVLD